MNCGSGGDDGAKAVVGSGGNHICDRGVGWACEGKAGDGKRFENWREFAKELKSKFCPQTVEYNVLHTLQSL